MITFEEKVKKRFLSKVDYSNASGCWIWKGFFPKQRLRNYGRFKYKGKVIIASRMVWELYMGPIPKGLFVCHHCDNPQCVRPNHLFLGTAKDNVKDMIKKQRNIKVFRENMTTHCKNGHSLIGYNLYIRPDTKKKVCRKCQNMFHSKYKRLKREKNKALSSQLKLIKSI